MGRAKVEMEPISDTKKRCITFQRRKESLVKKAFELSTLCDVNVALIIYNDQQQTPQIFPPDIDKFNNLIDLYQKSLRSDPGKIRSHDLSRKNDIEKAKKKNLEGKYPTWFGFLNDVSEGSLREFASELDSKVDKVKTRIESIKKSSKIHNLETYPASTVIVLDDVENPGPITSMISPNMDDYNSFGLFPGDQNSNVVNCDSMMSAEDYNNHGIDVDELFSDKDGLAISNVLMSEKEEDDKYWFDDGNFSLETDPLSGFCFSPEIMQPEFYYEIMEQQQPECSSWCMEMKEFMMPTHVMEYITGSGYDY